MGFDLAENIVVLDFSGTRYDGLEVRVRPDALSLAKYVEYDQLTKFTERLTWLQEAGALASWNLECKGQPVPLDAEGIDSLPPGLLKRISEGFDQAVVNVAGPLGMPSPDGSTSEAA